MTYPDSAASKYRLSLVVLFAANALPLAGVALLGWKVFPIVFLFWSENLVIGAANILKMLFSGSRGDGENRLAKLVLIPFFCVHYGVFCLVHGLFILQLFGGPPAGDASMADRARFLQAVREYHLGWPLLALALSHLFSFAVNYLGGGEFRRTDAGKLLFQPYARVIVMHVTVLIGGLFVARSGSPVGGLVLLVVLKTGLDAWAHLRERTRLAGLVPAARGKRSNGGGGGN